MIIQPFWNKFFADFTIPNKSLEQIALFQVFNNDMTSNLGFDGQTLMNSLKQYPTLYAAIFNEDDSSGERTVSAIQLLQVKANLQLLALPVIYIQEVLRICLSNCIEPHDTM